MPETSSAGDVVSPAAAPNQQIVAAARRYCQNRGLRFSTINPMRIVACSHLSSQIADIYEMAPLLCTAALPVYAAFRTETWQQLDCLTRPRHKRGLGFTVSVVPEDPYLRLTDVLADLANRRVRISASPLQGNPHPLLSEHDHDAFRAVRHVFGHGTAGRGFDTDGEEAAWWKHRSMYTPWARPAMTIESRVRIAALFHDAPTRFVPRKAIVLPERFSQRGTLHLQPCGGRCQP